MPLNYLLGALSKAAGRCKEDPRDAAVEKTAPETSKPHIVKTSLNDPSRTGRGTAKDKTQRALSIAS